MGFVRASIRIHHSTAARDKTRMDRYAGRPMINNYSTTGARVASLYQMPDKAGVTPITSNQSRSWLHPQAVALLLYIYMLALICPDVLSEPHCSSPLKKCVYIAQINFGRYMRSSVSVHE